MRPGPKFKRVPKIMQKGTTFARLFNKITNTLLVNETAEQRAVT